jgi:vesicle-associated membrane protein 7
MRGQEGIQYICVATGTKLTRFCQYPNSPPINDQVLDTLLSRIHSADHKRTLTAPNSISDIHYKVVDGVCYLCMAQTSSRARLVFSLLDQVEAEYKKGLYTTPSQGQKQLRQKFETFNDPNSDKINLLNERIDDLKDVMIDNIDKVLQRGDQLDVLVQSTENLVDSSDQFQRLAKTNKRRMWRKFILLLILVLIVSVIVLGVAGVIIAAISCGGLRNCGKKTKN